MGHCCCGAHSCTTENKKNASTSIVHEYWKVGLSFILLIGGIIMNALNFAFFLGEYVALIWYILAYLPVGIPVYRALMIEQDQRSAHHYFNNNKDVTGKGFVDVGCAEGYSSLEIIEEAKHVYLFEQNESWLEAIRATFEPWKDKVTIVQKYVSNRNSPKEQKLDDFFRDKPDEHLFIKMDIEGAERRALAGCEQLFRDCKKIDFAICTYHLHDDEEVISAFLDKHNCTYRNQKGFFRHKIRSVVLRGNKKVN